jgi:hypothetical protein
MKSLIYEAQLATPSSTHVLSNLMLQIVPFNQTVNNSKSLIKF